jgi:hypothetical protein
LKNYKAVLLKFTRQNRAKILIFLKKMKQSTFFIILLYIKKK